MRIAIAPDKFKGTLTSSEAACIIADGFRRILPPSAQVDEWPLADGGEGTCAALTRARRGSFREITVRGPLGEPVTARYGISGTAAFMEMASASGLQLVPKDRRNPAVASTFGFGEMLLDAIRNGATEIIAGIGGSATNDGGTGMAEALGARFIDADGREMHGLCGAKLPQVAAIDCTALRAALSGIRIRVASDVTNPLLGCRGTASVYAPQKGATPAMCAELERGMSHLYRVVEPSSPDADGQPGDGAAGGLGFGFRVFCHSEFESGARLVIRESGLLASLESGEVGLVVTGEGCTDGQTEAGKLCCELSALAHGKGIPCVLLSGGIGCPRADLRKYFDGVFISGIGRGSLEATLAHAKTDLASAAECLAGVLAIGGRL